MEKVKITREQAEAIENLEPEIPKSSIVKAHLNHKGMWRSDMSPLNALHADKLIQALYIGYEVEPELSEGDILFYPNIGTFAEIRNNKAYWNDGAVNDLEYTKELIKDGEIRHATESEIAAEKERRFWKKLDRKTREYRVGDLAKKYGSAEVREINYIEEDKSVGFVGLLHLYKPEEIKIVCPVENRLDVKENA